jgi:hypothetical protein
MLQCFAAERSTSVGYCHAEASSRTRYLDRVPTGWFPLTVCRAKSRGWDWVALLIDMPPEEHRRRLRAAQGRHKSRDAAWDAFKT